MIRRTDSLKRMGLTVGQKLGVSILVEEAGYRVEPSGHERHQILARCSCGIERVVVTSTFLRDLSKSEGRCSTCSRTRSRLVQPGEVFDKLTVIGYEDGPTDRPKAICMCVCGTEVRIRPQLLHHNKTNSCGCAPRGHWEGFQGISKTYYGRVQKNALRRNIEWSVTMEHLQAQYDRQQGCCALTGVPLTLLIKTKDTGKTTASLDRIDSSKGYTVDNVQWVHKDINFMKQDLPESRFIELCRLVATHLQ